MRSTIVLSVAASALVSSVAAHGNVTSPQARLPGPAMIAACGADAVATIEADGTIPLEDVTPQGAACKLDLCRGATFADNKNRVQKFKAGQVVPFKVALPIPHEGPANVSVVSTATNKVLGDPLIEFDTYADERLAQLPANNTDFSVKMPARILAADGKTPACTKPGECVLQWFWFGTNAKQTYESCVDFVMV